MSGPSQARASDILDRIVEVRRRAVDVSRQTLPVAKLEERLLAAPPARDFRAALVKDSLNVIAELKRASPSRGVLRTDFNPAALAPAFEAAGAAALSVLTEPDFFQGGLEHLAIARSVTSLPVLRKDFIFDPYQLFEARAAGADGVLLIAAILGAKEFRGLLALSRELGLAALVEVHTEDELARALEAGAEIIGVNSRDLATFEVKPEVSLRLIEEIPEQVVAVSESGLRTHADLERLRAAGFDAFLVGEHLMQSPDPGRALRRLLQGEGA